MTVWFWLIVMTPGLVNDGCSLSFGKQCSNQASKQPENQEAGWDQTQSYSSTAPVSIISLSLSTF